MFTLEPSRAYAEPCPPAGEDVQRRYFLDQDPGMAVRDARDHRPESDARRLPCDESECRVRLEHIHVGRPDHRDLEMVVHYPNGVVPCGVGCTGYLSELCTQLRGPARPRKVGDL